jgi:ankyrin repeat protein
MEVYMKCPSCGAQIDDDSVFCTECGKGIEKVVEKEEVKAPPPKEAVAAKPAVGEPKSGKPARRKKLKLILAIVIPIVLIGAIFGILGGSGVFSSNEHKLLVACEKGNLEGVKRLLEKNVEVNAKDDYGWTALAEAAYGGYNEIAEILINNGADVNAKDRNGWTALMWAAGRGCTEIVEMLIDNGADVNAKADDGLTALMCTAGTGQTEAAEILIERGADVNAKADDGLTALMRAEERGHPEIVNLLREAGAQE